MKFLRPLLLAAPLAVALPAFADTLNGSSLPDLGNSASSYVSLKQEHDLGRIWIRQLRAQAHLLDDPLMTTFLENLVFRLIPHSDVPHSELEFVVIDRAELNAFAVPGGIIGVNYGLLLYARDEDEISAVLAHELAHLSQRHYARQIEAAEKQDPIAIATLLASILLIATNNPDAGFAGLVTSQAASVQNQLAYSREWEREADRLGMQTLVAAGLDPKAMPSMFEQMLYANRFGGNPPEFLLTHPLTESRIADAADRAQGYPAKPRLVSFEFLVLQNDARRRYQLSKDKQATYFEQQLQRYARNTAEYAAAQYSLASMALEAADGQKGLEQINAIASPWNQHSTVSSLKARLQASLSDTSGAISTIDAALPYAPQDLELLTTKAEILKNSGKAAEATRILKTLSELRNTSPSVWHQLSEAAAAAEQPLLAYRANGEYLYYMGQQPQALRQMDLAIQQAKKKGDFQQEAALRQRLEVMAANAPQLR
ncbi:M48 family metalloprotease [Thalassolituus sp. LLYu03]|uniref:M48 family metalloprotease n=1 Tax=Thalassolituus sp. LLYu03 TaxID=3421656 RepID=UPI003D2A3E0D